MVLAKCAQLIGTDSTEATCQFIALAVNSFEREPEPYLWVEDDALLHLMTTAEEIDRVRRTLVEHKELRRLTNRLMARDVASLRPFDGLETLNGGEAMPFVNDHDRTPLLDQLQQRYGEKWSSSTCKERRGKS